MRALAYNRAMDRWIRRILLALVTAVVMAVGGAADAPRTSAASYDFTAVGAIAGNTVTSLGLPGASLVLSNEDGVLYEQSYGSYTSSTIVPIASGTKWISAL